MTADPKVCGSILTSTFFCFFFLIKYNILIQNMRYVSDSWAANSEKSSVTGLSATAGCGIQ